MRKTGGVGTSTGEMVDRRHPNGEMTREGYLNIRDYITRNPDA